ncbi:TM0106 family RecB-like putative nuclease [Iningainema tapete]|uniref:TM0106 family RecB-like putative nuclease n=1 Tax=Iningainema tapete BLCC-T55 TaxID=2748662 RepID=A0A8J6XUF3_9CYAN|nr:TM0106 family RecB-like putative nuclease [Iningainema tapete]MBD2778699.1 TM0106 family RecB-like putative nuclease [Iningainema tapete BLCC-T55]
MLINAELLLQYQRCKRRPFLDTYSDRRQRDAANDLLVKLQQDKIAHQQSVLKHFTYEQPAYPYRDWRQGETATLELMRLGVECIHQGVLSFDTEGYTLISRPDLLLKQPGYSCFGDWIYVPATIELGKRPKQEYQVVAAFHAFVLARWLQVELDTAWLILRGKESGYAVDLDKWMPQMQETLADLIQSLEQVEAPEVFISRQRCSLCPWYSQCYAIAHSTKHLSLLPGVTPVRYKQLQALSITTVESLAQTSPTELENLPGFDSQIAPKLVLQAQSVFLNRPLIVESTHVFSNERILLGGLSSNHEVLPQKSSQLLLEPQTSFINNRITNSHPIELYFDIEAQPDLDLDYLLGVLVVDKQANTEKFYSLLAEKESDEELIWQQFLDLVWQYPQAPIYHFCVYEFDTTRRLAKLYRTPQSVVQPVLDRFVDVYAELTQSVALPVESYALKAIARWLGFEWRDVDATGAKCIYWYDQWLKTGDHSLLEIIQRYNEDDCRATRSVKDWLVKFFQDEQWGIADEE